MKARDVIAEVFGDADAAADASVAQSTLLAQTPEGEGVYIAPDGELMALDGDGYSKPGDGWYRLVPVES